MNMYAAQENELFEHTSGTYINRELSLLEFHKRVLAQAKDTQHPLLERLNFLIIFSRNLDEFLKYALLD